MAGARHFWTSKGAQSNLRPFLYPRPFLSRYVLSVQSKRQRRGRGEAEKRDPGLMDTPGRKENAEKRGEHGFVKE